jgi:hypothetical protein
MKKKVKVKYDMELRFRNDKMDENKLNFLLGGDENGGQGGTGDPWGNG